MSRKVHCPLCGPNPVRNRSEYRALEGEEARFRFMESICDRCWNAILGSLARQNIKVTMSHG